VSRRALAVVALAAVLAACSSGGGAKSADATAPTKTTAATPTDAAATVNGVAIAKSDFDADLRDYAANSLFAATGVAGDVSNGSVSDSFARSTLQADILFEVVRQEVERRGLSARPPDDPAVRAQTLARFDQTGSPDIFNAFPPRFRDRALAQTAVVVTLEDALGGGPVDDAKAKATYDADPRRFATMCVRHVLLATEDDAKRVLAALQQGADFAETVDKESQDTSSEAVGGKILNPDGSCPRASQLDAPFAAAALAATPGQPAGPVQTKLGWHVLVVDEVTVLPYEQVHTDVVVAAEKDVAAKAKPAMNQLLQTGVAGTITVAPEYGSWDPANHQILPPGFHATPSRTSTTSAA
jgi:parvulin-like peptidyl-prolyl isomerase